LIAQPSVSYHEVAAPAAERSDSLLVCARFAVKCPTRAAKLATDTACLLIEGQMRIIARVGDDVSYAIAGVRDSLEKAMDSGLGQSSPRLPNIVYLKYLGDTENEAKRDSDWDGVPDDEDTFPNDATETVDYDGDSVGDNADAFPKDPTEQLDTDGNGVGDKSEAFNEAADTDGDAIGDNTEAFPTDPVETADTETDEVGDTADTNSTETLDTDGDGIGDNVDALPADRTEDSHVDGNATGNTTDTLLEQQTDNDGKDGIGSNTGAFPSDPTTFDKDDDGIKGNFSSGPAGAISSADDDSEVSSNDLKLGLMLAFGIPFAVALSIALLVSSKKCKRDLTSAELTERRFVTGDFSFNHFQSEYNLGTILEDEVYVNTRERGTKSIVPALDVHKRNSSSDVRQSTSRATFTPSIDGNDEAFEEFENFDPAFDEYFVDEQMEV
jgi:hypothetical protein